MKIEVANQRGALLPSRPCRAIRLLLLFAPLALLLSGLTQAAIIRVPDDQPTIQAGIDAAGTGDLVLIADGIYQGPGNSSLSFRGKPIQVRSENGPEACIIDCDGNGRGVSFDQFEDRDSILQDLTIRNGRAGNGGAVLCFYSSPTIRGCVFTDNEGANGGAISVIAGDALIAGCILQQNEADQGGGLYLSSSAARIQRCRITDNSAKIGGGVMCDMDQSIIEDCMVDRNWFSSHGGGIMITRSQTAVTGCRIEANRVKKSGGYGVGICCNNYSTPVISHCEICGNTGNFSAQGGGLYCSGGCAVEVVNCLIANNRLGTLSFNAGIFSDRGTINIRNCTIVGNYTLIGFTVEIFSYGPSLVRDCIIWDNSSGLTTTGQVTVCYCDIWGGYDGEGNIDADPLFTSGPGGEPYYLSQYLTGQSGESPCVDTGSGSADECCYRYGNDTLCLHNLTTRGDGVADVGTVNLGYHHASAYPQVDLLLPAAEFHTGDVFWLQTQMFNAGEANEQLGLCVLLQAGGQLYFWGNWSSEFQCNPLLVGEGLHHVWIIEPFTWPDTGQTRLLDNMLWGALFDLTTGEMVSNLDMIQFGYGPR